ncbi:MscS family membrane protein [Scopulibacillus darangshiensis]|uniref:MscS family membrane protein n=1 Tax=Scopulibacillus darangshiensis TaxID=442528 RepID=A0A4R2P9T9_9BACL|nr:mechanosensitive ion channel family protein [Scopulibacillus darangshiensis]TCP31820.1 MscS family membrane protein [Scopulibacillus darangshiensis]
MEEWFHWLTDVSLYDVGMAFLIFLIFFIVAHLFTRFFLKLIIKITSKTKSRIDNVIISSFQKPVELFLTSTGLYLALTSFPLPVSWTEFITHVYKSCIVIFIGWGLFLFSNATGLFFNHVSSRLNIRFDQIVLPFLSKIIKLIVVLITIAIVFAVWGYDINGLVAGLGIGGLAIALAAKETLSNFFGGLVIITETPFTIDDWIRTPSVEGTVEDINFRSTKIRTFDQAIVTVPNSTLANEPITNWSKMGKRRILFNLGLSIHTPKDKIEAARKAIYNMLVGRDDIDDETILVHFYQFSPSTLDLQLYFFTKTTDYVVWLGIKEEINTGILAILEEHDVKLGVPVQEQVYYGPNPEEAQFIEKTAENQEKNEHNNERARSE